jgi:CRP/FNR family transcriptional regulator
MSKHQHLLEHREHAAGLHIVGRSGDAGLARLIVSIMTVEPSYVIRQSAAGGLPLSLLDGWAYRSKSLSDGRRLITRILMTGDLIGLQNIAQVADDVEVFALTKCRVAMTSMDRILGLLANDPGLAKVLLHMFAKEEKELEAQMLSIGRHNAMERVSWLLSTIRGRALANNVVDTDGSIATPLTQMIIADALGLSLVHVNKTISRLEEEGVIAWQRGRVMIKDPPELMRRADLMLAG